MESGQTVGERLAGRTLLLTGATGFLGKAVLATLLRVAPEARRIVLPTRAPDDAAAARRVHDEVLGSGAFPGLGPDAAERLLGGGPLEPLAADFTGDGVAAAPERLRDVEVAIHCAATVSFEEALDDALALNAYGPRRLLRQLRDAGAEPHFVHVSTAYVADRASGRVPEEGPDHPELAGLDPDELMAEAAGWRMEAERDSRTGERLDFARAAERDASRREGLDAGARAEQLRRRWVAERLSKLGRRRALAAGWPDTYAFSKALGERLLAEESTRTTVVRPTIIESALRSPRPGWLEGIKVADPLILAYASRGLTDLPGRAENTIDLVPVDLVANACVAAAAHPPERPVQAIAVGSSARNPLAIGRLAEEIKAYFRREPLPGRRGKPIRIGDLRFVERRRALGRTLRRERLAAAVARAAVASPVPIPQERLLRSNRAMAERVTRMVKIYGAYTELDCVFEDENSRALAARLTAADRETLDFDVAAIDWRAYLQEVHLPEVRRLFVES